MFRYSCRATTMPVMPVTLSRTVEPISILYGCRRYSVQPKGKHEGKPVDPIGFDEDALKVLKKAKPHVVKDTGGPQREPPRRTDPHRR